MKEKHDKGIPKISWDYMCMVEKPTKDQQRPAEVEGEGLPIVVAVDSTSGAIFAYVVPQKGECDYAITRGCQDVQHLLGYKKMVFKGDQEPALQTMIDRVARIVGGQVIKEQSPVGESASNGAVENAVQRIQG